MEGRGVFGSKIAIVLATAGSAVGLGNVWRFPFMTGQNGGAAFILVYFGCVLLLGIPGMTSNVMKLAYTKNANIKENPLVCDYYLEKGDYVKLDLLTLGYTF